MGGFRGVVVEWSRRCLRNLCLLGWDGQCLKEGPPGQMSEGRAVVSNGKGSGHSPPICCEGTVVACAVRHDGVLK